MSDPFLTEFWHAAPPPWNTLGPESAATFGKIPAQGHSPIMRWAKILKQARTARGLSGYAADRATGLWLGATKAIENGEAGPAHSGWAKLAAFYGITLK